MTVVLKALIYSTLLASLLSGTAMAASNCVAEKKRFKELYIALQQSLNYEGKDAFLENGQLVLRPHKADAPYEGKIFEAALFKEYQLSLKKVAALYQAAKFVDKDQSNPALLRFIQAVDGPTDQVAEYIKNNKVDAVIDQLQAESKKRYKDAKHPALINDTDKYLLKKLLTHAQDRICSVNKFEEVEQKTGKQQKTRFFSPEELNKIRNAPLNRLINSIKNGKIEANSDLKIEELKDAEKAINLAITKNLEALKEWKKKNEACLKIMASPAHIQSGIQFCNYNHFLRSLDQGNENNLEAILHFINANEKFLNNPVAKAETALDELKLESYIDQTFANLGKNPDCPSVKMVQSKIYVHNLVYSEEKKSFDTSVLKITCTNGKIQLDSAKCEKNIEFVSDRSGEGVEIRAKKSAPRFNLKVESLGKCYSLAETMPELSQTVGQVTREQCEKEGKVISADGKKCEDILTQEHCNKEGKAKGQTLVLNKEKNICEAKELKTQEQCDKEGKEKGLALVLNKEKNICEVKELKTQEQCDQEGKEKGLTLVLNKEKNICEAKELKTQEQCDQEGKEKGLTLVLNKEKNVCEEKQLKTQDQCDKEGKEAGKTLLLNAANDTCEEKKEETKPAEECAEESKTPGKKFVLNKDTNKCEEESKAKPSKKDECEARNDKWISEAQDGEVRTNRYSWDEKTKSCNDKQAKKSSTNDDVEPEKAPEPDYGPDSPPPRFTPVTIPTRQMYILPGMP